uniref:crossover junction endonuclease MUS81 n=1 Tax=Ciona intestinalis TaxID=7719 RepID=UPI000180B15F|nr:crossover junction endonuclease MUS81 [Ciona intestinalis]|eukprot:XP_002125898.1 crossover junction endonuclease MUS81 [Ciona intestinalis]
MQKFGKKRKVDSCPNRLFLSYLKEWKDDASEKELKSYHTYNKAYKSLEKYGLPLQSGKEAVILANFGEKICAMLDTRLGKDSKEKGVTPREFLEQSRQVSESWWKSLETEPNKKKQKTLKVNSNVNRKQRTYVPVKNSGAYALLIALSRNKASENSFGYMKKAELQREAQTFCTKSFTVPDPGSQYTAWSSMATLINKELVKKHNNPAKYEITDSGLELAQKLDIENQNKGITNTGLEFVQKLDTESQNSNQNTIENLWKKTKQKENLVNFSDSDSECEMINLVDRVKSKQKPLKKVNKNTENYAVLKPKAQLVQFSDSDPDIEVIEQPSKCVDLTLSSDEEISQGKNTYNTPEIKSTVPNSNPQCSLAHSSGGNVEFCLEPGDFDVVLCVDTREVSGDKRKKEMQREIQKLNVETIDRVLQIGDFVWVAKEKSYTGNGREIVLDYIVERKCMADLAMSIRDGRFHEQKIRLKQCGAKKIVYLVEDMNKIQHQSLPEKTLRQALINTQFVDDIFVKYSENIAATAQYLGILTTKLKKMYRNKTLLACEIAEVQKTCNDENSVQKLLSFDDFNDGSLKGKGLTITEMFVRQLMQLHGMSYDKADTITQLYPTPYLLVQAYKNCESLKQKQDLLAKIKTGLLKRNLGANLSKVVYHVFHS